MRIHVLERAQRIERPLPEVFPFYAGAGNLERITPPWLGFEVTTPRPIEMEAGALIAYRLKLHGMPVRWRTRIDAWDPPHRFVDAQLSGPYSSWRHTHTFRADGEGATVLGDRARYALPFGPAASSPGYSSSLVTSSGSSTTAATRSPRSSPNSSSRDPGPRAFLRGGGVGRRGRCSRSASRSG